MNDYLSGYGEWLEAFADWTDVSISELHGLMTGIVCACNPPTTQEWIRLLEELSFAIPNQKALELLSEYGEDVSFALKDKDDAYAYEPLVPDDEHEIEERILALKDWAGGFITGIGVADCHLKTDETELLADLAKIASIRLEEEEDFAGGEEMYLHLFEFARMVPVSLASRNKKNVTELALIKGLQLGRKTAQEIQDEKAQAFLATCVTDAMHSKQ
ncbi:MAG: UPF0149 family protein [Moraxella sp.]|nr:UPF0149 family protein [Moraxella sp.]